MSLSPGKLVQVRKKYQAWCNHIFLDSEGFVCRNLCITPLTKFLFLGFQDDWYITPPGLRTKTKPIAKVLLGDKILYVNPAHLRISR